MEQNIRLFVSTPVFQGLTDVGMKVMYFLVLNGII